MRRRLLTALAACLVLSAPPAGAAEAVWTPTLALPQQGFDLLSAFPDGTAYVEHTNGGDNLLFRSTDFGRTWTPATLPAAGGSVFARFATPKLGYAVPFGHGPAYRSTDGAATWQPVTNFPVPAGDHFSPGTLAVSGNTVMVLGTTRKDGPGCNRPRGTVMTSHDRGATWRRTVLPSGASMAPGFSARLLGSRDAAVVFYEEPGECETSFGHTAVWVTHDGGRTFARRAVCPVICTAVGLATRDRVFVGRVNGTTAVSNDGGRTFAEAQRFTDTGAPGDLSHAFWVQAFVFSGRVGYASTKAGSTWRTTSGGYEWKQEFSHEATFGLGIGEVAMFDAERAIVGGPSAVSARQVVGP